MNSWDYFQTLLALDYAFRFIENLLYTWPPPRFVVDYLSSKLPNTSINLSTRKTTTVGGDSNNQHVMSSERYNKEEHVEYGDIEEPTADQKSVISHYGSRVTIVTRS
jgi:hypothetical protein